MAGEGEKLGPIFEGKTLEGRYHLKKLLAAGGFGAVFHAEHRIFGKTVREVAIKITVNTNLTSENLQNVFGEAIVSARVYDSLEGSGVTKYLVPVYDLGILREYEDRGFIVMGLVRGADSESGHCDRPKTLAETIENWKETGMPDAMDYMRRICEAVGALHEHKVIHRDLKPDNILLSERGQIRLVDLGLAVKLDEDGYARGSAGTFQYMAPETGRKALSNRASDVYSLGLIAYELLAGQRPYIPSPELSKKEKEDERNAWLQQKKEEGKPVPPSTYGRHVEGWQDRLVLRCLNPLDYARPQSASELRELIESAGKDEGPPISGSGWAEWFGTEERDWTAEAAALEPFLGNWGNRRRNGVWFEAATKLAVCYLSLAQTGLRYEPLLRDAEKLIRNGEALASYQDRATWYGGLAGVMERRGRAGLLKSEYREQEEAARSHLGTEWHNPTTEDTGNTG